MAREYSIACENDDIREDLTLREAKKLAKSLRSMGRQHIVINVQDEDGDLIGLWKFNGNKLEYSGS